MRTETNLCYWALKCPGAFVCVHLGVGRRDKQAPLAAAQIIKLKWLHTPKPSGVGPSHFQKAKRWRNPIPAACYKTWAAPAGHLHRPRPACAGEGRAGPGRASRRRSGTVRSLAPRPHGSRRPEGSRGRTRPAAAVQTGECASPASSRPRCGRRRTRLCRARRALAE